MIIRKEYDIDKILDQMKNSMSTSFYEGDEDIHIDFKLSLKLVDILCEIKNYEDNGEQLINSEKHDYLDKCVVSFKKWKELYQALKDITKVGQHEPIDDYITKAIRVLNDIKKQRELDLHISPLLENSRSDDRKGYQTTTGIDLADSFSYTVNRECEIPECFGKYSEFVCLPWKECRKCNNKVECARKEGKISLSNTV